MYGSISDPELETLVRTGALHVLRLGARAADLAASLGEPEDNDTESPGLRRMAFRGRQLQVALFDERVVSFGLYFRYGGSPVEHPGFSDQTTRAGVEQWLRARDVPCRAPSDHGETLALDHGVHFVFSDGQLESIQVS